MQHPVPAAAGSAGMVCSIDRRASEAGIRMLASGGNAVDAVVATAAVLAVVAPNTCGMGGDMFALVGTGEGAPLCLNGSGRAPSGASAEQLRADGHEAMPRLHHPAAVTVPGCVDGWLALHSRLGIVNLPEVLGAAHAYAADGFAASADLADAAPDVATSAGNTDIPGDLRAGDTVRRPGSARALEAVAAGGREAFYGGEFGEGLLGLAGGLFSTDDLATPVADWVEPATVGAWGHRIWTVPPNSQGYLILAAAALAQELDLPTDPADPDWAHWLIEAARAVGSFRPARLSDAADVEELLDPDHLADLRRRVLTGDTPVTPLGGAGDTTYLCAADADMAVSLIQSNAMGFGSRLVAGSTGIFLHNRGLGFNLDPGHPACYGPGRRPPHTLSPALVSTLDGRNRAVLGTMGGDAQPQVVLQMLARLLHCGETPAEILGAGRWLLLGPDAFATWTPGWRPPVALEPHAPTGWATGLAGRGHDVVGLDQNPKLSGHAHLIDVSPDGTLSGAAEPRTALAAAVGV
ncbi:MAG: gamma-glutamyltransferase [bacterium]|nr:gamma-glutamyltransferase [bacterium]